MFIGAGWEQEELIKTAKKLDFKIIATNPYIEKEVAKIADRYFVRESNDIDSHFKLAKAYNVHGILTDNCDYSLYTAAFISEKLSLPSVGISSASFAINKKRQRKKCSNNPYVKQPVFFGFKTIKKYLNSIKSIKFPFIVKPNDSRGTFGVTVVRDKSIAMDAFFHAISNSPSRTAIVEDFIEGTLFTVDGFCFDDRHKSLAVASRKFIEGPHPVTKEIIYPAQVPHKIIEKLKKAHDSVVRSLAYTKGHTHGEYIVNENGTIYLVECTNRGGGVFTSSTIVPEVSGIDLNQILINQMIGNKVISKDSDNNPVILSFLDFEVGKTIKSIEILNLSNVLKFRSIYGENDIVESVENCASRHMMLVMRGNTENLEDFEKRSLKIKYY